MQHSKIHPWKSLMRQRTCSWLTRLQSLLAQQGDKGEGCFYSQFELLFLHPENLPLSMLLKPVMPVSEDGTQHAARATRRSENHPPLTSSRVFRSAKALQKGLWGKNLQVHAGFKTQCTAFTVITGRLMEKKIQFSSFKTNSDNQLVRLRL